jgi:hypothetical protein
MKKDCPFINKVPGGITGGLLRPPSKRTLRATTGKKKAAEAGGHL